jgi:sugar phosphate isomerase/epimerase
MGAAALVSAARLQAAAGRLESIGMQLYTVRDLLPGDFYGTLEALREIGFRELEFAGYYDQPPAEIRARLDDLGLTAPATHMDSARLRTQLDGLVEISQVLGHRYVVCSWVPPEERGGLDQWSRLADELAGWAEKCRAAGLQLAYHNHDFELTKIDGERPLDRIVAGTDASALRLELDLYWVHASGLDPEALLRQYADRVELVHVKDAAASGGFTEVGSGVIAWPAVLGAAREIGVSHYFVEQDRTSIPPLESLGKSFGYLNGLEL